jgi:hypothetical protein
VSKCHVCGLPDTQTVLVKCQWFGRGTKWVCVDCLRSRALTDVAVRRPHRPDPADAGQARPDAVR